MAIVNPAESMRTEMSEDYGEPWKLEDLEVFDRDENTVIFWDSHVDVEAKERIVAAVNFCQHVPTETLEALAKEHIGAATLIQWIRRCNTYQDADDILLAVCPECCETVSFSKPHAEDCLLKKALDIIGKDV